MTAMIKSWEQGRAEMRAETQANDVLTVLRIREIAVPDDLRERILTEQNSKRLQRWLERAVVANAIGDVIDDPS